MLQACSTSMHMHKMTSWPPACNVNKLIENPTLSNDAFYWKKNPAKFHPDPIWNDGALGFFEEVVPTRTTRLAIADQFLI